MTWTVIVPLKSTGHRKTRLAPALSPWSRDRLALAMFRHVSTVLGYVGADIVVLSPSQPEGWHGRWQKDRDGGLNVELAAVQKRLRPERYAVIHADLPLLCPEDVSALFAAAEHSGLALAPDRLGIGTNALAVADGRSLAFHFGPRSLAGFVADAGHRHACVRVRGLEWDIDTPSDLARATDLLPQRSPIIGGHPGPDPQAAPVGKSGASFLTKATARVMNA